MDEEAVLGAASSFHEGRADPKAMVTALALMWATKAARASLQCGPSALHSGAHSPSSPRQSVYPVAERSCWLSQDGVFSGKGGTATPALSGKKQAS